MRVRVVIVVMRGILSLFGVASGWHRGRSCDCGFLVSEMFLMRV